MIKTSIKLLSLIGFSLLLLGFSGKAAYAQEVTASYQDFYDQLAPYGQWVTDPQYGDVWVPSVEAGFRPYGTDGYWAMTEYGNMWVSDQPFAWAVYHYGRWTYNPYYGWVWIPGNQWAPAWVMWRQGEGFYGWAPMGPGFEAGGSYVVPDNYWMFVGAESLYQPNVYSYYVPDRNMYYMQHTAYIHETYNGGGVSYNYGPRAEWIERDTHRPVQVYRVSTAFNPHGSNDVYGNTVNVYRPAINPASERTSRPANVIRASQPIGKPMDIPRGQENAQPAFRQEVQAHNQQTTNQNNRGFGGGATNANNQPGRPQGQHFQSENSQPSRGQATSAWNEGGRTQTPAAGQQRDMNEGRAQSAPQANQARPQSQPAQQGRNQEMGQNRPQSQPQQNRGQQQSHPQQNNNQRPDNRH